MTTNTKISENIVLNNGICMPINGFGCFGLEAGADAENAVYNAIKIGYRHIDTAYSYLNENSVGIAVKKCIEEGICKREDLFITTKLTDEQMGYNKALEAFELSLERLGLDYIDAWLIHTPGRGFEDWEDKQIDTWRAMEKIYKEGRVRAIGLSQFEIKHLIPLLQKAEIIPQINQLELHPSFKQTELTEFCIKNGIVCGAWGSLNKGAIVKIDLIQNLAEKYQKTPSQIALRWSIQKGFAPISKTRNIKHLEENYNIFDFELSEEDMKSIDSIEAIHGWYSSYGSAYREMKPATKIDVNSMVLPIFPQSFTYYLFSFIPLLKRKRKWEGD